VSVKCVGLFIWVRISQVGGVGPPNTSLCNLRVEVFMKFLITNDDGIEAPGIRALANAVARFGEVVVAAPEEAHSGCGHRVTTDRPISIRNYSPGWWAIDGTPADCSRVGLREIAADCDWVLAGVNAGANLGVDIFMSGTVAAVREAALLGRPGIAFSHYRGAGGTFDWNYATATVEHVIKRIISDTTAAGHFWNVNLPDLSTTANDSSQQLRNSPKLIDCPIGRGHLPVEFLNNDGKLTYRGVYHDVDVCFGGNVAVTRLSVW
jgi:5'-nucleotidase